MGKFWYPPKAAVYVVLKHLMYLRSYVELERLVSARMKSIIWDILEYLKYRTGRGLKETSGAAEGSWLEYTTETQAIQDSYAQTAQWHLHSTGPKSQALSEVNGERHTSLESDSPHLSQTSLKDWEIKDSVEYPHVDRQEWNALEYLSHVTELEDRTVNWDAYAPLD